MTSTAVVDGVVTALKAISGIENVDNVDIARRIDINGRRVSELTIVLPFAAPGAQELALGREDEDLVTVVGRDKEFSIFGSNGDIDRHDIVALVLEGKMPFGASFRVEHNEAVVAFVGDDSVIVPTVPVPKDHLHNSSARS